MIQQADHIQSHFAPVRLGVVRLPALAMTAGVEGNDSVVSHQIWQNP
jgi:hypothetical protein